MLLSSINAHGKRHRRAPVVAPPGAPMVFRLTSTSTGTHPFAIGFAFKQGDVPSGSGVVGDTPVQVTPKNYWPDGSLKFALVSGQAALTAGVERAVTMTTGTFTTGTALTTADLKATGITASITPTGAKDWTFDTAAKTVGARLATTATTDIIDATSAITVNNGASVGSFSSSQDGAAFIITGSLSGGTAGNLQTVTYSLKYKVKRNITAITKAANARITMSATASLAVGNTMLLEGIGGMTELNGLTPTITAVGSGWFEINVDSTAFTTYTSGGTATRQQLSTATATTSAYVRTGGGLEWNGTATTYAAANTSRVAAVSWATTDWDSPFQTWVSGHEMSSWVYRKPMGTDPHLVAWLEVRLWASGAVEVLPWIENGYAKVAGPTSTTATWAFALGGTQRYSGSIEFPHHTRSVLLSGTILSHWLGTDPAVIPRHDGDYLSATHLVPTYRAQVAASATMVTGQPGTFTPMQQGQYPGAMGSAGYHPSIGLLPQWDALYLACPTSSKPYEAVCRQAYSAGRYGLHWRDHTTNLPIIFASHPHFSDNASGGGDLAATETGTAPQTWKVSHHPSVGYVAYLVTGRRYFLDEVHFAATYNYIQTNSAYRQQAANIVTGVPRYVAWSWRTLGQAACITPDADTTMRAQFITSLANNGNYYYDANVALNIPHGFTKPYAANGAPNNDGYSTGVDPHHDASWMQDFWIAATGYVKAMALPDEFDATSRTKWNGHFTWKAQSLIGRFGGAGATEYLFRDAGAYTVAVAPLDASNWDTGAGPWYANFGEVWVDTIGPLGYGGGVPAYYADRNVGDGSLRGGNYPSTNSYWGNLMPALAYCVQHGVTGAQAAYDVIRAAPNWASFDTGFQTVGIEWGLKPPGT